MAIIVLLVLMLSFLPILFFFYDPQMRPKRTQRAKAAHKRTSALDDLAEVAGIMAGSRHEWSKMNRDAMENWERRFDPERERRQRLERQRATYYIPPGASSHPVELQYAPPPQYMPSPFDDFVRANPGLSYEGFINQYTKHRMYRNRQDRREGEYEARQRRV